MISEKIYKDTKGILQNKYEIFQIKCLFTNIQRNEGEQNYFLVARIFLGYWSGVSPLTENSRAARSESEPPHFNSRPKNLG